MGGNWKSKPLACFMLFCAIVASVGCDESIQMGLKDTEGRTFKAECTQSTCSLRTAPQAKPSAPKPDGSEAKFVLHVASRLFAVCEVWVQGSSHAVNPADCRALICSNDRECPPAQNMTRGVCTNGLCIEPSAQISNEDAVLLCLAGTGAPSGTTQQVERYALGNACATPCIVPAVCRQP